MVRDCAAMLLRCFAASLGSDITNWTGFNGSLSKHGGGVTNLEMDSMALLETGPVEPEDWLEIAALRCAPFAMTGGTD